MRFYSVRTIVFLVGVVLVLLWLGTNSIEYYGAKGLIGLRGRVPAFLWTATVVALQGALVMVWRRRMSAQSARVLIGLLTLIPALALMPLAVYAPIWNDSIFGSLVMACLLGYSFGGAGVFLAAITIYMHGGSAQASMTQQDSGQDCDRPR